MKPFLIRHIEGQTENRFPVWMMRQAGRYLASYREVRKQNSFWQMVTQPKVAVEVTLQPVQQLDVDAAILFSDILTLPYGMGVGVEMREGVGPVVAEPMTNAQAFSVFKEFQSEKHVGYVYEALQVLRKELPKDKALLGFCGAPWTVGCYLIEGKPSKEFERIQKWMYSDPKSLQQSLGLLAQASSKYLVDQIQSGADMVQVFDTWLARMPKWFFVEYYTPILKQMVDSVHASGGKVAFYTKNAGHVLPLLTSLGFDLLSCDSLLNLEEFDAIFGGKVSLQGNLSPQVLLTDPETVRLQSQALWRSARKLKKPAVLNLGHGILPGTPVENVKVFLSEARTPWS